MKNDGAGCLLQVLTVNYFTSNIVDLLFKCSIVRPIRFAYVKERWVLLILLIERQKASIYLFPKS